MRSLFLVALVLGLSSSALARSFCDGQRARSASEQIATLDPSFDFDFLEFDVGSIASVAAGYEYEVEPAYTNGLYARTDRWRLKSSLIPSESGDLSEGLSWSVAAGMRHSAEATFIRFFDNACLAETVAPYSPRRIPMKAATALGDRFATGDYFVFKASMGFVISGDLLKLLGNPLWAVRLNANYLIDGSYQIHVVRLDQKHVRLKIVARRGKEAGVGVNVGWSGEFDVFGVSQLDRQLRRIVDPEPLKVSYHDTKARVFLVDYVLNLEDPAVADAFDKVLRQARTFQSLRLASPFRTSEEVEEQVIMDLGPLEDLYRADYENGNLARIRRSLRSNSDQDGSRFSADLGNRIVGFEFDATSSTSRISFREADESVSRYLLRSFGKTYDGRFGYSWSRLFTHRSIEVLLRSVSAEFEALEAQNIVQTFERKDSRLRKSEFLEIKRSLEKALPTDVFKRIPFDSWKQGDKEVAKNFGLRYQLVMGPEVVLRTPGLSASEIIQRYRAYLTAKGLAASDFYVEHPHSESSHAPITARTSFEASLRRIGKKLSRAVDGGRSHAQRLESFVELRRDAVFAQTGIGFLLSLHPEQTFRVDLSMSANNRSLVFSDGDEGIAVFYKKILQIKDALENDGLDLRRLAEGLTQ